MNGLYALESQFIQKKRHTAKENILFCSLFSMLFIIYEEQSFPALKGFQETQFNFYCPSFLNRL